jgi:hypothetical protein
VADLDSQRPELGPEPAVAEQRESLRSALTVTVEEDYAIVRRMLLTFEADDWDVDAARHALQRLYYVLLRADLIDRDKLGDAIEALELER